MVGTQQLPPDFILPQIAQGATELNLPYSRQKSEKGSLITQKIYTELSYVKNVADGLIKLYDIAKIDLKQNAYNISGGRLYSIDEVIDITKKIFQEREIILL